ncbi:uncharacterized protein [Temnothorax nylanderi]|uniref:uncharacterized protein n=1 Tax=Temnothorax nylanderi TaxID=102681 RepID=UPI003A8BB089
MDFTTHQGDMEIDENSNIGDSRGWTQEPRVVITGNENVNMCSPSTKKDCDANTGKSRDTDMTNTNVPDVSSIYVNMCSPSTKKDCDVNTGKSRDAGMTNTNVPNASSIYVNNPSDVVKEAYTVSGSSLKERDPSSDSELRKYFRFEDDYKGKAKITLRLPPHQTTTKKGKNHIKMWMILNELQICPTSITMVNHFSAEAEFKHFRDSNSALNKIDALKDPVKLKANLEQRSIVCRGVITDWPSTIPSLWTTIQDKSRILGMERMYRRKWDPINKKTKLLATDNIIVMFKDKSIRDLTIFNNGINLRVRPYVPQVRQCFNCFRFGHNKLNCKSDTRCIVCGDKAHGQCEKETRCCNCGGHHKSTFRGCPLFEKTKNINIVMAHRNISFHSAKRAVEGDTSLPPSESGNKFINPSIWPDLPASAGPATYSEALGAEARHSPRASTSQQKDKGDRPPRTTHKDKQSSTYDAPRNYYKSSDLYNDEATRTSRGLIFSARRRTGNDSYHEEVPPERSPQDDHRIIETIESILLLLRRTPEAREMLLRALTASDARDGSRGGPPPSDIDLSDGDLEQRDTSRYYRSNEKHRFIPV